MKVIILAVLIAVAMAESSLDSPVSSAEDVSHPYSFSYNVEDSETSVDFDHSEKLEDKVTTGSYRVALPDGRTQIVTYRADKNGYTADVKYEGEAKYPEFNSE